MKEFKFKIGGTDYAATVEELEGGKLQVNLNGKAFEVEMPQSERKVQRPAAPAAAPKAAPVAKAASAPAPAAPAASAGGRPINAPLPGVVIKINAKVGDKVSTGDTILVLEAMKMENNITADSNGTIKAILCKEGDQVQSGQALVELD
jgi:biotin carboxyl carrier protein